VLNRAQPHITATGLQQDMDDLLGEILSGRLGSVSTTAHHVIELVRSLPEGDQQAIRDALSGQSSHHQAPRRRLQRLPDGGYLNPNGISNEDPVFRILDEIEEERHRTVGRPAPEFD
jgi:hypothetical protein